MVGTLGFRVGRDPGVIATEHIDGMAAACSVGSRGRLTGSTPRPTMPGTGLVAFSSRSQYCVMRQRRTNPHRWGPQERIGDDLRFPLCAVAERRAGELERDDAVEAGVVGLPDLAHAAGGR